LPFLFESACWWTSALYPFPSSPCEGRCFLHCDENLAALLRPVALGPHTPPSSQNNLAAIHRPVELGPTRFDCHSPLCRAWPHFPRFDSFTSLAFPTAFSTLWFHHRHLNTVLPLCWMARCRGRHSSSLSAKPALSFSFSPQLLPVTIIQSQPQNVRSSALVTSFPKIFPMSHSSLLACSKQQQQGSRKWGPRTLQPVKAQCGTAFVQCSHRFMLS